MHALSRTMGHFRGAFAANSKSACHYPKFHHLLHYYDFILEYGVPSLTYTGWWEKAHIFLVKRPYLRTGGRKQDLYEKMLMRVIMADRVRRMNSVLDAAQRAHDEAHGILSHPPVGSKRKGGVLDQSARPKDDKVIHDISMGYDNDGYLTIETE